MTEQAPQEHREAGATSNTFQLDVMRAYYGLEPGGEISNDVFEDWIATRHNEEYRELAGDGTLSAEDVARILREHDGTKH